MSKVFTVGDRQYYDKMLKENKSFVKNGRQGSYPGGFALKSKEDADKLICEFKGKDLWAVYELNADWKKDTEKSKHGWWHALLVDSVVIRKVI